MPIQTIIISTWLMVFIVTMNITACSEDPIHSKKWDIKEPCQGQQPCMDSSADLSFVPDMELEDMTPPVVPPGMAFIPAGSFMMGTSTEIDPDPRFKGEAPIHEVYLSRYAMDIYEVTVNAYALCVEQGGCTAPKQGYEQEAECNWMAPNREDHPINCVDWFQAKAYCEWAGKKLPTEAQWEMAARGPDSFLYPWGNEPKPSCERVVVNDPETFVSGCGEKQTLPVGSRPKGASIYGVMDLIGNVAEWCNDFFDREYYASSPRIDPQGPDRRDGNVIRGNHFKRTPIFHYPYSSQRNNARRPEYSNPTLGFRCAKNI